MYQRGLLVSCISGSIITLALGQPGDLTGHLKVDQFGYQTADEKICLINNPHEGFDYDLGDFYIPGSALQVVEANSDTVVYSGAVAHWHNGAVYAQSGDELWWFDFSDVTASGTYYIYDPSNDTRSFEFEIRDDVYLDILRQAMRMFFYQRSGFAKDSQHAGVWYDAASHLGTEQDLDCRLVTNPVSGTSKSLEGGWYDAGDYNKYVNFTYEPVHDLMLAFIERPEIWTDDYNIPESGNGIPDILDEVKWELDWLLRMQEENGSVLMKVSVTNFQSASPPSADSTVRRYGPAQASATRTCASMFAISAIAYNVSGIPSMEAYADTLQQAAADAWDWVVDNPGYSYYDNAGFSGANPEMSEYQQFAARVGAAVALFALTGESEYKDHVDGNYDQIQPLLWGYWYPWESVIQDLLLYYSSLPTASSGVATAIRDSYIASLEGDGHLLPAYDNETCGYRAYLNNGDNVWGSNRPRGHNGTTIFNAITYDLPVDTANCRNAALGYLNFLHGVNPISTIMLTNMYDFGGDKSANEMYHGWFHDGTDYDNALTSLYGPAPGYQPGGFNPHYQPDGAFGGTISPPQFQPSLKSYKDWNTSWPENSWEVTETSISNQGSYIKLLSKFVELPSCGTVVTSTSDSGPGSLREILSCVASGDSVSFAIVPGDTIFLESNIYIDRNVILIFEGIGTIVILSTESGYALTIGSDVEVAMVNLTIASTGEGNIENSGELHFENVILDATAASGPALNNLNSAHVHGVVEILK